MEMNRYLKKALRLLPPVIWTGVIFSFSLTPDLTSGLSASLDFFLRKGAHAAEFFILTILLFDGFPHRRHWRVVLAVALLVAVADEWIQTFVPGREGSLRDVGVDATGIALGFFARGRVTRIRPLLVPVVISGAVLVALRVFLQ